MKKKLLLAGAVFMVVLLGILYFSFSSSLGEQIETVTVKTGSFKQVYKSSARITSQLHTYYFSGYLDEVCVRENDEVHKDDILLRYYDVNGDKKELKSKIDGYVQLISNDCVSIYDKDYYLTANFKQELLDYLETGSKGIFTIKDHNYSITVKQISEIGKWINDQLLYEVVFSLDSLEGIKLFQQGNIILNLKVNNNALMVRKEALLEKKDGYYLLEGAWLNSSGNSDKYLKEVKVLMVNDEYAWIDGVGLEGLSVCIISDDLKGFLVND